MIVEPPGPAPLAVEPNDRVLVVGGYGVRNVGDEAILAGLLSRLPGSARVTVVSRDPDDTRRLHGVNAVAPVRAASHLWRADALVIGGGGLFSGHMGPLARWLPVAGLAAKARRARVTLASIGVYPSTPAYVLRLLAQLARRADACSVRDTISQAVLAGRGVEAVLARDLSAEMPDAADGSATPVAPGGLPRGTPALVRSRDDGPLIGLCLTATDERLTGALLSAIPRVVDLYPDARFLFIPMSQHPLVPAHDDRQLGRLLQEAAPRIERLDEWLPPATVLSLFSQLDAVVGMRYHSLLFAERARTPLVPISYAEKCDDWLRSHQVQSAELRVEPLDARLRQALAAGDHRSAVASLPRQAA